MVEMELLTKQGSLFGGDEESPLKRPDSESVTGSSSPSTVTGGKRINDESVAIDINKVIDSESPKLERWLANSWQEQSSAITVREVQKGMLSGKVSSDVFDKWSDDYSRFITEKMTPIWEKSMLSGVDVMVRGIDGIGPENDFQLLGSNIAKWLEARGGQSIQDLTVNQYNAVNSVLTHHVYEDPLSVSNLSKVLRPIVGLTPRDSLAVSKRFSAMISDGATDSVAEKAAQSYAASLKRKRSERIARTEIAMAYNNGARMAVEDAVSSGAITDTVLKRWYAQEDERTCPWCGELDGQAVGIDQTFPAVTEAMPNVYTPPAHPNCRCIVLYELQKD
jgi:SPP1 gp7 family putative phage head morphogenesis protein